MSCQRNNISPIGRDLSFVTYNGEKYKASWFTDKRDLWVFKSKSPTRNPDLFVPKDMFKTVANLITEKEFHMIDRFNIKYDDKITLNAQEETILRDLGNSPEENAKCYGSNAVALPSTAYVDLDIDNLNGDMYLTYTDPVTQDILDVTLPTATKYRMINDFSNAVSHDKPFEQADLDLMKADPLTLMRVWFDGLVLPSGFAKVNIKHYYPASCGVNSGSFVQDICVDLGARNALITGSSQFSNQSGNSITKTGKYIWDIINTVDSTASFSPNALINNPKDIVCIYTAYIEILTGTALVKQTTYEFLNEVLEVGSYTYIYTAKSSSSFQVQFNGNAEQVFTARMELSSKELIGYAEIQNYTDACRTTYLNTNKGMSNLLLEQDASGRPTGITPITTGNGKHIVFPMLPTPYDYTAPMCFKEAHGDTSKLTIVHCDDTTEVI